jgi:hypothetical protein
MHASESWSDHSFGADEDNVQLNLTRIADSEGGVAVAYHKNKNAVLPFRELVGKTGASPAEHRSDSLSTH